MRNTFLVNSNIISFSPSRQLKSSIGGLINDGESMYAIMRGRRMKVAGGTWFRVEVYVFECEQQSANGRL